MPPPSKAGRERVEETEHRLQAVLLSDSYNTRFRPLTFDKPRCLLPLVNRPLIEYTFEFLAFGGVQDVYVFCSAHADQIKAYIKYTFQSLYHALIARSSKWSSQSSPFTVHTIISPEALSVGDAMRELDAKQLITSDFVLVAGDVVSNISLQPILKTHRQRRNTDRDSIMTMMVREATALHKTRAQAEASVFVLDGSTGQCVYYDSASKASGSNKIAMDLDLFSRHSELQFRNDLIDCQIDICSGEVPALFTENFDYQDIRRDFVHGILTSDILGKTIYCHLAKDGYAARVRSLQTYDAISRDVLTRWTYPMVLDSNFETSQSYRCHRGNIYTEKSVVLQRSSKLVRNIAIGSGTKVGENTVIQDSVVGRNCTIGSNTTIRGSYIWNDSVIGSNCDISNSIVAGESSVGDDIILEPGAAVGSRVKIGDGARIYAGAKLMSNEEEGEGFRILDIKDPKLIGAKGVGFYMEDEPESEMEELVDDFARTSLLESKFSLARRKEVSVPIDSEISEDDLDLDSEGSEPEFRPRADSTFTAESEELGDSAFVNEALQSLERAFEENHTVDNAVLELNTLRMAENANYMLVRTAVITALLQRCQTLVETQKKPPAAAAAHVFQRWGDLLSRMLFHPEDQIGLLLVLQRVSSKREDFVRWFVLAMQCLYNYDIVEEEAFVKWFNDPDSSNGSSQFEMLRSEKGAPFIEWLEKADEESEESESE